MFLTFDNRKTKMNESNDYETCGRCKHYKRYYEKRYCSFKRTDFGFCSIKNGVVNINDTCEQWLYGCFPREITNGMVKKALEDALLNVSVLAKIFGNEEDCNTR